jgi:hypothetical protein
MVWEGSGERLVVVKVTHPGEEKAPLRYSFTVALGRPRVMNQLGLAVADLREEMKVADGLRRQGKVPEGRGGSDGVQEIVTPPIGNEAGNPAPESAPSSTEPTQTF